MAPVIRVDDQVMDELKKRAIGLGLVFEPPNATLRRVLDLDVDVKASVDRVVENAIEVEFRDTDRKYGRILLRRGGILLRKERRILPGFKKDFELETDVGIITAHVIRAPKGTPIGDPNAGTRIRGKLRPWFDKHPELKDGTKLRIEALEPGKRYKLSVVNKDV